MKKVPPFTEIKKAKNKNKKSIKKRFEMKKYPEIKNDLQMENRKIFF